MDARTSNSGKMIAAASTNNWNYNIVGHGGSVRCLASRGSQVQIQL